MSSSNKQYSTCDPSREDALSSNRQLFLEADRINSLAYESLEDKPVTQVSFERYAAAKQQADALYRRARKEQEDLMKSRQR